MLFFIRVNIEGELNGRTVVQPGYLSEAVTRFGKVFNLPPDEHERLVKHLETIFGTKQEDGHLLRGSVKEWYPAEKASIDFYYWRRLEKYWKDHSILPKDVIRSVDGVTDEILGYLGNPRDKTGWNRRRGLVMSTALASPFWVITTGDAASSLKVRMISSRCALTALIGRTAVLRCIFTLL